MTDPARRTLLAHTTFVRDLARRLVLDEADADDIAQQAWLNALRRPPETDRDPRPWLATVVRNAARSLFRSRKRRRTREADAARPDTVRDEPGRESILRSVTDAVLSLDEPYRDTVLLRFYEGLPPREIAARQGVPVETVRTRTRRALARLRERLDGEHDGTRERWATALLPLCRTPKPRPGPTATLGTTLGGLTPVLIGAGAVALVAVLLWRGFGGADDGERADTGGRAEPPIARKEEPGNAQKQPAARPQRILVTGRVIDDRDRPLRSARVHLVYPSGSKPASAAADESVRTDPDGRFAVRAPGSHAVRVSASAPGFAPALTPWLALKHATANAGTIRLEPGRTVAGKVVDTKGRPLRGAKVVVETERDPIPDRWLYARRELWTETGADGTFRFAALPAGPYRLIAEYEEREAVLRRADAGDSFELHIPDDRGDPTFHLEGVVRTADGKPTDGDVSVGKARFAFAKGRIDAKVRVPGGSAVWIRAAGHAPFVFRHVADVPARFEAILSRPMTLRGRVVAAFRVERIRAQRLLGRLVPAPTTHYAAANVAADGSFRFDGLAPGWYRLTPDRSGPGIGAVIRLKRPVVAQAGTAGHVVEFVRSTPVEIDVEFAGAPGDPVEDRHFALYSRRTKHWLWTATGNGSVTASLILPDEPYRVMAWATLKSGRILAPTGLDFVGGKTATLRVPGVLGRTVPGRVVDQAGRPVAGARVRVLPRVSREEAQAYFDVRYRFAPFAYTDENGRFACPGIPIEPVRWQATAPGYAQVRVETKPALRIVVQRARALVGRIVDPAGGPTGQMYIRLVRDGAPSPTDAEDGPYWAGGSGFFRLYVAPGRYRMLVWEDGGPDDRYASLEVDAGNTDVVAILRPGGPLQGRVIDAPPGARVVLEGSWGRRSERVGDGGEFHFRGVPREGGRVHARTLTRRGPAVTAKPGPDPVVLRLAAR